MDMKNVKYILIALLIASICFFDILQPLFGNKNDVTNSASKNPVVNNSMHQTFPSIKNEVLNDNFDVEMDTEIEIPKNEIAEIEPDGNIYIEEKKPASLDTQKNSNILTSFDIEAYNVKSLGEFKLTAYCPCTKCCGKWGSDRPTNDKGETLVKTASGAYAYANHTIAVDPKVIPYGTVVIIERNGVFYKYVAEDCGGSIKNKRIDVYHNTHSEAYDFGVKYGNVYIIIET